MLRKHEIDIVIECPFNFYIISRTNIIYLSAAFDTIDHSLLISRLANIGITGNALNGLRHTFLIVLLLFLSMGTYHLLEIFLTESPKALY